jgi:hypothetical protein
MANQVSPSASFWDRVSPSYFFLMIGVGMIIGGCVQSVIGFTDRDAANHEATAPGVVVRVDYYRSSPTYYYEFRVNGGLMQGSSGDCNTSLTRVGCNAGGQVLVYYTYEPFNNSKLGDFADASRHAFRTSLLEVPIGLLIAGVSLLVLKLGGGSDSSKDTDDASSEDDFTGIPIAPKD